ncbi:MAG: hypothetical protein LBL62_01120 [Planctomycetaceae bacterium]|nr:hypothetical protein [Planctomycetaceae bacterium]
MLPTKSNSELRNHCITQPTEHQQRSWKYSLVISVKKIRELFVSVTLQDSALLDTGITKMKTY